MKYVLFVITFCLFSSNYLQAQKNYTDHQPSYRKWRNNFYIDKIKYTKKNTIFYLRLVYDTITPVFMTPAITFVPPGGAYVWYIRDRNIDEKFPLQKIKCIRRNRELLTCHLDSTLKVETVEYKKTVFTCQLYFPRLPSKLKQIDLIEGVGQDYNSRKHNFFAIEINRK